MSAARRFVSGWFYECPCEWWTEQQPGEQLTDVEARVRAHREWHRADLRAILARAR